MVQITHTWLICISWYFALVLTQSADVLVVGAGAAGLAASRDLSAAGYRVIVIEARERVGGRIHTLKDQSLPVPVELGAEFIHGKPPELFEIIESAHLPFSEVTDRYWYFENGELSKSHDFWAKIEPLMEQMKTLKSDMSFKDYLASLPDDAESELAKAMTVRYVEGFHAARIDRIGIKGLIKANEAAEQIDGDKSFRLLRGYADVSEWLYRKAESHGTIFRLNTLVDEVRWKRDAVEIFCRTKDTSLSFTAPRALITLPLGVLQASEDDAGAVHFIPALPQSKRDALNALEMGHVVRIVLHFRERFWEKLNIPGTGGDEDLSQLGFIHCPDGAIPTWWTLLPERASVLVGWAGGPAAEKFLARTQDEVLASAFESLARIFGQSEDYIRDYLASSFMHDWQGDPFTRGAYAYIPVNGLDAQLALSRPVENTLFFAGEATSAGHIGTVHGAIQSGRRAAKEVISSS
jgi:monoamine oxidase